ncbi:MAG: hypothetical protein A3H49_11335 [Nitrospirae bacterium RIFCSPLOWO2_02_FULL_62_14]|nr:MAG: hypothetical protein A3H49_11335 [Nitrospirae bacterium RIFCSPLOWO2_02_FULL_62_14]
MATEPLKTPPAFSRRLLNIVTIIDRYHVEASRKGDTAFAEALKACALTISGGNMLCPLGQLVVNETVRTGKFPLSALTPQAPRQSPSPSGLQSSTFIAVHPALKAVEWQHTFTKLWTLLEEEAKRSGDKDLLSALQDCEELTKHHACPVRELIASSLGQSRKP